MVWSAGSSTGEEWYAMALLLREYFSERHDWTIHILATEINHRSLKAALAGIYCQRSVRQVEPVLLGQVERLHDSTGRFTFLSEERSSATSSRRIPGRMIPSGLCLFKSCGICVM